MTSVGFLVGWIVISIACGLFITFFLGLESPSVRHKRKLKASKQNSSHSTSNGLELESSSTIVVNKTE